MEFNTNEKHRKHTAEVLNYTRHMKNNTGKLYVFEGPDNVGKTTIAKAVNEIYGLSNKSAYISFPGNESNTVGSLIYRLHHDTSEFDITEIDNTCLQALHIASHIDAINRKIIPLLKSGTTVFLDRFWWSTFVYGKLSNCNMNVIKHLIDSELAAWDTFKPRAIFYLNREFIREHIDSDEQILISIYDKLFKAEQQKTNSIRIVNANLNDTISNVIDYVRNINGVPQHNKNQHQQPLIRIKNDNNSHSRHAPSSIDRLLSPTIVYDTYWMFAAERQNIFFKRLSGDKKPWTNDSILANHKFTNAYRASDRVSQYLIKNVIYNGSQDTKEVFFRTILFKLFNKIETWVLLSNEFGEISYKEFDATKYDKVLTSAIESGKRIYSAAYIMPTGGRGTQYHRKHRMHLELLQSMMKDDMPHKVEDARSMGLVFEMLRSYHGIGDFLAYQYATDINYSEITNFSETQFVVPGPGARDGIMKCFNKTSGLTESEIIKVVMELQHEEFQRLEIDFKSLWGRPLQLIDCQNLFCETDKYARIKHPEVKGRTGRSRIKQKFQPTPHQIDYWYPPKWGINELIRSGENT